MATVWGSWTDTASSTNLQKFRLGCDYTITATGLKVNHYLFESTYAIYKTITLTRSGNLSGTYTPNVSTSGGVVNIGAGGTVSGNPGSSITIGGKATNVLHGLEPSFSLTVTVPAQIPSTPAKPTINTITSSGGKVNWSHPNNNGATLTEYEVQRATNSSFTSGSSTASGVTGTSYTLSGLTHATTYYVRIRVKNSVGWSSWSSTASFKTLAKVPSTPAAPTVGSITATTARGTVTAPSNNGATISNYGWEVSTNSGFTNVVKSGTTGTTLTYDPTGLTAATTYYMRVRAYNSIGWSSWSASRQFTTTANKPGNVSSISVSRTSDTSHTITWVNNPTSSAPYTGVQVWRKDNVNTTYVKLRDVSATTTSYTDATTVADREYNWKMVAVNAGGSASGAESSTQRTTPKAPTNATATRVGDNIRVQWTNNSSYTPTIQIYVAHGGTWQGTAVATVAASTNTYTIVAPNPTIVYTYRVRAASTSPTLYSEYSTTGVVQLQSPPNAPTITGPSVTQDLDVGARLTWNHNPVDASEQRQYRVQHRSLGAGSWTQLSITASENEYHDLDLSAYSPGDTVEWQVMTWGSHATGSAWSATSQFDVANVPVVSITNPEGLLEVPTTTLQWTYYETAENAQVSYQYRVELDGVSVASGTYNGSNTSQSMTYVFMDKSTYEIFMRVRSSTGLYSEWTSVTVDVEYPTPPPPYITATWRPKDGAARIKIRNPKVLLSPMVNDITNPKPEIRSTDSREIFARNLAPNPSFEAAGSEVVVRTNLFTNPRLVGSGTWAEVARNLCLNPFAAAGGTNIGFSNAAAIWTVDRGVEIPGLGTASRGQRVPGSTNTPAVFASMFNVDGLLNTGPARRVQVTVVASIDCRVNLYTNGTSVSYVNVDANTPTILTLAGHPAGAYACIQASTRDGSDAPAGAWLAWSHITTDPLGRVFSGSTMPADIFQPEDFRVRWIGTENASESVMEIEKVLGLAGLNCIPGVSTDPETGEPAVRLISTNATANPTWTYATYTMPSGSVRDSGTILGTRYAREPNPAASLTLSGINSRNPDSFSGATVAAGRFSIRHNYSNLTSTYIFMLGHGGALGSPDIWWTDIGLFAGEYDGPFFHGGMDYGVIDPDLTARWTGPENASASVLSGVRVANTTPGNSAAMIRSTSGASDRDHAGRLIKLGETQPYATIIAPTAGNQWVHIRAVFYQEDTVAWANDFSNPVRRMYVNTTGGIAVLQGPTNPGPGFHTRSLTISPSLTLTSSPVLHHGSLSPVGSSIWIDSLVVLVADTEAELNAQIAALDEVGGYFDGETANTWSEAGEMYQFGWEGNPDNSVSVMYRDVNTQWDQSHPLDTHVGYSTDELGATVWEFHKKAGVSNAAFYLPEISVSNQYVTSAADVTVVSGASNTRASYGVTGTDGDTQSVRFGDGTVRVIHEGVPIESGLTPTVTVRGNAEAVVHVKRMIVAQGEDEDSYNTVYFDGDTEGAAWDGTPGDSSSTLTTRSRYSLITNPSFESGTTGWTVSNLTAAVNTNGTYVGYGSQSLRLTEAASPSSQTGMLIATARNVTARQAIAAGIKVSSSNSSPVKVRVVARFLSGSTLIGSSTSEWVEPIRGDISSDGALVWAPPMVTPAGASTVQLRLETDTVTGISLYVDDARVMLAADVTTAYEQMWNYFDADSVGHINEYGYTMVYSANSNSQRERWDGTQMAVYNDLYRSVDDGTWKRIARNLPLNATYDDTYGGVTTELEYYAEAVTIIPTRESSNVARLLFASDDNCDIAGVYMSGPAPNFETVAGLRYNLRITEMTGRAQQEHYYFAGQKYPITISTPGLRRSVRVSGTIVMAPEAVGGVFKQPKRWRKLSQMVSPLCYRDDSGRVITGTMSDFTMDEVSSYVINISFTMTETWEI